LLSNGFHQASSLRQPSNHREDAVGDAFEFRVDIGQRARRLEDVEVAVEGDLVADLGFVGVDPGVGSVGQHLAFEVGLDVLAERDISGVAQGGVGDGVCLWSCPWP